MIPGIVITDLIRSIGVFGLMGIIFAESGLLLGFFLPGDTLLFAAGFLATKGVFGVNVHILVGLLFAAAVLGDSVGYTFGRKVGPKVFKKPDSILFHQDNLSRAATFYERFGSATILLARFIPVVRTFAPVVAGVGKMNYKTFLGFNLIGGLLWAAGIAYAGYFAGAYFEAHGIKIDNLILPVIAGVMVLTFVSPILHIIQDPKNRGTFLVKVKLKKRP